LDDVTDVWGASYPAITRLWENAWAEFIPFLDYGGCRRIRAANFDWRGAACGRGRHQAVAVTVGSGEPDPVRLWVQLGGSSSG
jgi:putative transposase